MTREIIYANDQVIITKDKDTEEILLFELSPNKKRNVKDGIEGLQLASEQGENIL